MFQLFYNCLIFVFLFFQNYRAYSFCGTIEYMAPEVVEGGHSGHDFVSWILEPPRGKANNVVSELV